MRLGTHQLINSSTHQLINSLTYFMKLSSLTFRQKFTLLIFLLVILISAFLMVTTLYFLNDGKRKVQHGVTERLEVLRKESMLEFSTFAHVAEEGINQASGLASIEKIVSITTKNQENFMNVINDGIGNAGEDVVKSVDSSNAMVQDGLDGLVANSADFMDDMMEFDNRALNILANMATFNILSLNTSSMQSLGRFRQVVNNFEKTLLKNQTQHDDDLDTLLIRIIDVLEKSDQPQEEQIESLMRAFESVKHNSFTRQHILYQRVSDEFDLQSKVVAEELKLMNQKIRYAINLELGHAITVQDIEFEAIIDDLLQSQRRVQKYIAQENETLYQALEEVKKDLPLQLREEGELVLKQIEDQSHAARQNVERARTEVSDRIKESTQAAAATFEAGIVAAEEVIKNTLARSSVQTLSFSLIVAGICVVIALGLGFFETKTLTQPLHQVVSLAERVANGDFSENLDMSGYNTNRQDEIGTLLLAVNEMVRSFRKLLAQVQRSGLQIASSSKELKASAREQEASMATQMDSTNKAVASVQEIADVAANLEEVVQHVASMAQGTAEIANNSQAGLSRMQEAMHRMEHGSETISGRLETINAKAENITNVVTMINRVAEQTNLLSLNAAIEAEKAGEFGRGFAVVAREIRRLADQTGGATLDIDWMVKEMQSAVSAGVMEMDKFITEVRHGVEDVENISSQLALIIEQVQALTPNFEEVREVMGHQSENARKINSAMALLSEEMQQTKSSLQETYSVIQQLNTSAGDLQEEVSRFKIT